MTATKTVYCQICGVEVPIDEAIPADLVRASLLPTLMAKASPWDPDGYVSLDEVNKARLEHVQHYLEDKDSKEAAARLEVFHSIEEQKVLSIDTYSEFAANSTFGQRMADKIASFGGSWKFIGIFALVLIVWMFVNASFVAAKPWDPYPFILLNLVLSCVAAIQAPVIMMSQNRQEERDRLRAENDYKVNLKSEIEVRHLNEKIDRLLNDQWKHLMEIQQMQVDMIQEMDKRARAFENGKNG